MKYLLLLLISFNVFAQYQVKINPSDNQYAKMQIDCESTNDCNEKLIAWIGKQDFFTGNWNDVSEDSIASRVETLDNSSQVTSYYHASNYSVEIVDISAQLQTQALEALIKKRIDCGDKTIQFIAKSNAIKNLTKEQRKTMVSTYSQIFDLLKSGSVDIAIDEINAATPDGVIVTSHDKIDTVAFIQGCM